MSTATAVRVLRVAAFSLGRDRGGRKHLLHWAPELSPIGRDSCLPSIFKCPPLGELAGALPKNNIELAGNGEYGNGDHEERRRHEKERTVWWARTMDSRWYIKTGSSGFVTLNWAFSTPSFIISIIITSLHLGTESIIMFLSTPSLWALALSSTVLGAPTARDTKATGCAAVREAYNLAKKDEPKTVKPSVAFDCLESVPVDVERDVALID